MKSTFKYLFYTFLVAAVMVFIVGCGEDPVTPTNNNNGNGNNTDSLVFAWDSISFYQDTNATILSNYLTNIDSMKITFELSIVGDFSNNARIYISRAETTNISNVSYIAGNYNDSVLIRFNPGEINFYIKFYFSTNNGSIAMRNIKAYKVL